MQEILPLHVDLQSYSSSEGWLGFFELSSGDRRDHAGLLVDRLMELTPDSAARDVYTNLHTFHDDEELRREHSTSERDLDDFLRPLRASGLLRAYRHYAEVEEPMLHADISFNDLRRALVCLMDVDGVSGHLFVHLGDHDLLLYPHDDIGFGFVAGSNRGEAFVTRLLTDLPVTEDRTIADTWTISLR